MRNRTHACVHVANWQTKKKKIAVGYCYSVFRWLLISIWLFRSFSALCVIAESVNQIKNNFSSNGSSFSFGFLLLLPSLLCCCWVDVVLLPMPSSSSMLCSRKFSLVFVFFRFFRFLFFGAPEILGTMHFRASARARAFWFFFLRPVCGSRTKQRIVPFISLARLCESLYFMHTFGQRQRYVYITKTSTRLRREKETLTLRLAVFVKQFRIVSPCLKLKIVDIFRTLTLVCVQLPLLLLHFLSFVIASERCTHWMSLIPFSLA